LKKVFYITRLRSTAIVNTITVRVNVNALPQPLSKTALLIGAYNVKLAYIDNNYDKK